MKQKYFIPNKLDIDLLIADYPPKIDNFKKAHLLYIVSLIYSIPANNKGLIINDGYVPINASTLQKKVRNYKPYLDYLIENNVLETNGSYSRGKISKGFRLSSKYSTLITAYKSEDKIKRTDNNNMSIKNERQLSHLIRWFNNCLQIDKQSALDYILCDYEKKTSSSDDVDWKEALHTNKNPVLQYNSAYVSIEKFSGGRRSGLSVDDFGFRLHSPLTNIRSELRNLLTYNSLSLVSIDINNSQPYLSSLLFNLSFWDLTHKLNLSTIGFNYSTIFSSSSIYSSFIMLCKNSEISTNSDVQTYKRIVSEGVFYEYIAEALKNTAADRKNLKAIIFQVLFTDNRYFGQEDAGPKRIFSEMFPDVYQLLSMIKRKNKVNLPMLLQRIESHLILHVITKRVAKEKPMLPIFTIHDSIVTVLGNESYIKKVMEEEMSSLFGLPPQLSISFWKPENLSDCWDDYNAQLRA